MPDLQIMSPREYTFRIGWVAGGLAFYPWQIAVGLSLRYWPYIFTLTGRAHLGPFKGWIAVRGRPPADA
jgi:hypothetical protein